MARNLALDSTSEYSFGLYRMWLSDCIAHLNSCSKNCLVKLPHRVLEVKTKGGIDCSRLIESQGSDGQYATLSHRWGKFGGLLTTRSSLCAHLEKADPGCLSKTVYDAVTVTRSLGLTHLWIDTLCIIQDDVDDWKRESSRMDSIYRLAHITIAASGAKDGTEGCFHKRTEVPAPVTVPIRLQPGKEFTEVTFKMHAGSVNTGFVANSFTDSTFSERGWCL